MPPRDKDDRAVPPGLKARDNGDDEKPRGGPASDESEEDGDEDFELSEESLQKLSPKTRAIAAVALRAQRENAELKSALAQLRREPAPDEDEEDEGGDEPDLEAEIKSILDEIPDEGYEKLSPSLKKVLGGVIRELVTLRQDRDRERDQESKRSVQAEFRSFKRANKDWEEYDSEIAGFFRALGVRPRTQDQLEAVLEVVKAKKARPKLEQELASAKRAGAVPKLTAGTPSMIERLRSGRADRKPARNLTDAFAKAYGQAERQAAGS